MSLKSRYSGLVILAALNTVLAIQMPAFASSEAHLSNTETITLSEGAQTILLTRVLRIKQTPVHSTVTLQTEKVLKNIASAEDTVSLIEINIRSGSVIVDPEKPSFSRNERCIVFLTQNKDGAFEVVDGRIGKKTIINNNVYLDSTQSHVSVKLQDYLKIIQESQRG